MKPEFITAENLTTPHGFFTHKGGASSGLYASLNCGFGSNDSHENVTANRARVKQALGVPKHILKSVYQVHSASVAVIDAQSDCQMHRADAMVTKDKGVVLGILTADCAPILFADEAAGIIGAAHSGWKGAIGGVSEATIDAMVGLGATRENITAVVGPTISQEAYEVGVDFYENFIAQDRENAPFFIEGQKDRMQFGLPSFCLHRLRSAGIKSAQWTGHCTYADPERFFSYRRSCHQSEPDYGRLISVISL